METWSFFCALIEKNPSRLCHAFMQPFRRKKAWRFLIHLSLGEVEAVFFTVSGEVKHQISVFDPKVKVCAQLDWV